MSLIEKLFRPYKGSVYRLGMAMPEPEYETATGRRLFTVSQMEKFAAMAAELRIGSKCIYTLCADDSPTPNTLESGCGEAVLWYLGDDGKGEYPKFCYHCGGAVVSGGLAND